VLPGDVYRVVELDGDKNSRFATTTHVVQLKSWNLVDQEGEEDPGTEDQDGEDADRVKKENSNVGLGTRAAPES